MKRTDAASHAFLGEEFLTWLWFRLETEGGEFDLGKGKVLGVVLDDFLAFAPSEQDETEQILRKGLPTRSAEAAAALRGGRRLRRAKLLLAVGERQWSVVVDGPTLGLRSVRLPEDSEEAETPQDRNLERVQHFLEVHDLVGALYHRFLQQRLRPDYLKTAAESQAQWMSDPNRL